MELPPKPIGKFNDWCERKPLVFPGEQTYRKATGAQTRKDLTQYERAILYHNNISGCKGIEFVAISNCRIHTAKKLAGQVWIVPCFLDEESETNPTSVLAQRTRVMNSTARFVYDGWLGLDGLSTEEMRRSIRLIDESLAAFSLLARSRFRWYPKYGYADTERSAYYIEDEHLDIFNDALGQIEKLPVIDRKAVMRGVGWLSQSVCSNEPSAKFLASILAIESLATYIEKEAGSESVLAALAVDTRTKAEKRASSLNCIRSTIESQLKSDPVRAIQLAYFDCVGGIKRSLEKHVSHIFGSGSEYFRLLFDKVDDRVSLYNIRHKIAHGSLDAISDYERYLVDVRVWDVERIARRYIWAVLNKALGLNHEPPIHKAGINIPLSDLVVSDASMYQGPVHMGLIYS